MELYKKNMKVKSCDFTYHTHLSTVYLPLRFENCTVEIDWRDTKISDFFSVFDLEGGNNEEIKFADVANRYCIGIFNEDHKLVGIQHLTNEISFIFYKEKEKEIKWTIND